MKLSIIYIILVLCITTTSCATGTYEQIPPGTHGKIFQSFNRINQNIWGAQQNVASFDGYKSLLAKEKKSDSKESVSKFLKKMDITICPMKRNFVVCGYWKEYGYTFCDNARKQKKHKKQKLYFKESHKSTDNSKQFKEELGCKITSN